MPTVYQNHRENQIERILEAAEGLFIRDGIDNVSMTAIAKAARLSRKTLYEYFPNKQEIAFAIFQKFVADRRAAFDLDQMPEGSGFERLRYLLLDSINVLEAHPEHIRFIVEFNTLYARGGDPARVREIYAIGSNLFTELIQEGIADGSIRPDLDPDLLSAAMLNLVSALNSRFALLGKQIAEEYGQPVQALYGEICHIFLLGIQSERGHT